MGNTLNEPREATLLFGEITSYTLASERLVPAQLVAWVGETVACVRAIAEKHGGRIEKFLGDSLLVVFEQTSTSPQNSALECAHEIRREIRNLNLQLGADGWPPVTFSMGIHAGEITRAQFETGGSDTTAVLGSAVALVARIQSMTQEMGSDLLISGAAFSKMDSASASQCIPRGSVALRSGDGEVAVYELEMTGMVVRHERPPVPALPENDGPTRIAQLMAQTLDAPSAAVEVPPPAPEEPKAPENLETAEASELVDVHTGLFVRRLSRAAAEEYERARAAAKAKTDSTGAGGQNAA